MTWYGWLARILATFILPTAWVLSGMWWTGGSDLDALIFLLTDIVEWHPIWAPWVTYVLWIVGAAFQYGLYRHVNGPGGAPEAERSWLREIWWSAGFYSAASLILFFIAFWIFLTE